MSDLPFTFSNALLHIFRTDAPKGFLWKYAVAYGLIGILFYGLMFWAVAPVFSLMLDPDLINDEAAMNAAMLGHMGQMMAGYAVAAVGGILLWVVFEAAGQRRYMRGEGFSLRIGADEGRLLVVGLMFFGIVIASYIGLVLIMMLAVGIAAGVGGDSGAGLAGLLIVVAVLAYLVGLILVMVRLSPAASLTIRDRSITFFSAWRVSKGKAWAIFGCWVVLYIAMYVIMIVLELILLAVGFSVFAPVLMDPQASEDPSRIFAALASPGILAALVIVGFALSAFSALFMHAFSGPAALAAKTDPEWVDQAGITDTFG